MVSLRLVHIIAHPFIKTFESTVRCKTQEEADIVAGGGSLPPDSNETSPDKQSNCASAEQPLDSPQNQSSAADTTNPEPQTSDEEDTTITVELARFYIGLRTNSKKLDIAWPVNDFTALVRSWDSYDASQMNISISYLKRYLPVFK